LVVKVQILHLLGKRQIKSKFLKMLRDYKFIAHKKVRKLRTFLFVIIY
jgi:hypothetical protein